MQDQSENHPDRTLYGTWCTSEGLKTKARELRKNATEAEQLLWQHIRRHQLGGYRFRRQQPLGKYIVDFFCFEKGLVIELDGGQHSEHEAYDSERTAWLEAHGFCVLRLWNNQVLGDIEAVKQVVVDMLNRRGRGTPPP